MKTKQEMKWIDDRIGTLGIAVRQSQQHDEMIYYLELLGEEIETTRTFLAEDGFLGDVT